MTSKPLILRKETMELKKGWRNCLKCWEPIEPGKRHDCKPKVAGIRKAEPETPKAAPSNNVITSNNVMTAPNSTSANARLEKRLKADRNRAAR